MQHFTASAVDRQPDICSVVEEGLEGFFFEEQCECVCWCKSLTDLMLTQKRNALKVIDVSSRCGKEGSPAADLTKLNFAVKRIFKVV